MADFFCGLATTVKQGFEDVARGVQGKETGSLEVCLVTFNQLELGLTVSDSGGEGVVTYIDPHGEAAYLGCVTGDRVVSVGSVVTTRYCDVTSALRSQQERPLELGFERRRKREESIVSFRLDEEIGKAERILAMMLSTQLGPSRGVLQNAKGLALLRVTKLGFALSGRFGTGIVVARLPNGWSAPSAIGTVGLSMGVQVGAQVADFLIVLNTAEAVVAFSGGGQLTLGAQIGAVAGPVGASREAGVAGQPAAVAPIFTYSISKGLFVGASLEGSAINERTSVNERHYARRVRAVDLLSGKVPATLASARLHAALAELDRDSDYSPPSRQQQDSTFADSNPFAAD